MTRYTSDESLVEGLHAGRRDAFERLYDDEHAAVYNLCARIVGDREEAKDLTQDVFMTAFNSPPAADQRVKLRPWLFRVATNACFNHLRSRRKLDGGGGAVLDGLPDHVDEYRRAETVALVEASLGELNERYRAALVLKDLHGLPPAEIAEVMEVSRPAADVLVHRARASFKAVFTRLAGEDATAPAALGLVLVPMSVPAALQTMPLPLANLMPVHALPHPGLPAAAGPAGAGLLTKIGAALTTKAAIGAAAGALIIGGGAIAVKEAERGSTGSAAAAASTVQPGASHHSASTRAGLTYGHASHHGLFAGTHRHEAGHHTGSGAHTGDHAGSGAQHAGDHAGSASHDAATHDSSGGAGTSSWHEDGTTSGSAADHATSATTSRDADHMSGAHAGDSRE